MFFELKALRSTTYVVECANRAQADAIAHRLNAIDGVAGPYAWSAEEWSGEEGKTPLDWSIDPDEALRLIGTRKRGRYAYRAVWRENGKREFSHWFGGQVHGVPVVVGLDPDGHKSFLDSFFRMKKEFKRGFPGYPPDAEVEVLEVGDNHYDLELRGMEGEWKAELRRKQAERSLDQARFHRPRHRRGNPAVA